MGGRHGRTIATERIKLIARNGEISIVEWLGSERAAIMRMRLIACNSPQ